MKRNRNSQKGFGLVGVLIAIATVVAIAGVGTYVYHRNHPAKVSSPAANAASSKTSQQSHAHSQASKPTPYANWKTYIDTGYAEASGISVKYPADWAVKVGGSNAFAWEITPNGATTPSIDVRDAFLSSATTPQEEWDNCPSADACGPAPGSTKVQGNASTINGLDSYTAKMQTSAGVPYYATIIKGNKPTANGTVVFVELIITNPDASTLNTYNQVVGSATF